MWTQGCSIRCAGCINPHLFSARGGREISANELVASAVSAGVEGLTFLGGEPFDQSSALGEVAELAHEAGLGVICFTGYTYESLLETSAGHRRLLAATDLLVDGPYIESTPEETRSLVGSANQRFIHLTGRYRDYDPTRNANRVDVRVGPDGTVDVAGFLNTDSLKHFIGPIGVRRARR